MSSVSIAQSDNWAWISGQKTIGSLSVGGTVGVSDACNTPGNIRGAHPWTDDEGNLWYFGGIHKYWTGYSWYESRLNEIWKYFPGDNSWTKIREKSLNNLAVYGTKGVGDPANTPGGRMNGYLWQDNSGFIWYFGGDGYGSGGAGAMNDFWKYNTGNNTWTYLDGGTNPGYYGAYSYPKGVPGNYPGGRYGGVSWTDNEGKLWMMGGSGYAIYWGSLNEVWCFDPSSGLWTWVSGQNSANRPGIYGTLGVASTSNYPGGREYFVGWKDSYDNFWIYGGYGYGESGAKGYLSDLWCYYPATNEWAWMGGNKNIGAYSVHVAQGVADPVNQPGARAFSSSMVDSDGRFWLYGGSNGTIKHGDLWSFDPSVLLWTWEKGNTDETFNGNYGIKGILSDENTPGARESAIGWSNSLGKFWLLGGNGYPEEGGLGGLNDFWSYGMEPSIIMIDTDGDELSNACDADDDNDAIPDEEDACQYVNLLTVSCDDGNASTEDYFDLELCACANISNDGDGDGFSSLDGDCNDNNAAIYPGNTEIWNGMDDDCDEIVDEDISCNLIEEEEVMACAGESITLQTISCQPFYTGIESLFDQFTMLFTYPGTDYYTPATEAGKLYKVKITGTYTVWSSYHALDAAYYFAHPGDGSPVEPPEPLIAWQWSAYPAGITPPPYNPLHEYYFYLCGDGSAWNFQFSDYIWGDNSGALQFTIYEVDPQLEYLWTTGETSASIQVSPLETTVYGVTVTNALGAICTDEVSVVIYQAITVDAGSDEDTYYGLVLDQTVVRTPIITGGTEPYLVSWTMNRPILCDVITLAGDEVFEATDCIDNVCSGTEVPPFCTGNVLTTQLIDTAIIYVTVTDANGCIAMDSFTVNAEDVRCFPGASDVAKIKVCHQTGSAKKPCVTICIDESAVEEHLAHGDFLGNCNSSCSPARESSMNVDGGILYVFPNPTNNHIIVDLEISTGIYAQAELMLFNLTGQLMQYNMAAVQDGLLVEQIQIDNNIPSGIYTLVVQVKDQEFKTQVVIQK